MLQASYQSLSVEEKTALLKSYYTDLDTQNTTLRNQVNYIICRLRIVWSFVGVQLQFLPAVFWLCFACIFATNLGLSVVVPSATLDKSVSDAIKVSKQISMTKSITLSEKNIETTLVASKVDGENGSVSASTRIWSNYGYFYQSLRLFFKRLNLPF